MGAGDVQRDADDLYTAAKFGSVCVGVEGFVEVLVEKKDFRCLRTDVFFTLTDAELCLREGETCKSNRGINAASVGNRSGTSG